MGLEIQAEPADVGKLWPGGHTRPVEVFKYGPTNLTK